MYQIGMCYYECGMIFFELGEYEKAITNWIKAYELGYEQEIILKNIYECFIIPNEQEFKNNFAENSFGYTQSSYEDCALDFIPVSETDFYIFDRNKQFFCDKISLEKNPVKSKKIEFSNILFTDTWDVRKIFLDLKENQRDMVFILLEEQEPRFVSFFKLPQIRELYFTNIMIFQNEIEMQVFFEENEEIYLPRQFVTANVGKFVRFFGDIHEKRIRNFDKEHKNVFLSVCIPSYNRGNLALKNIKHLLSCPYDSEIEIIISDNGSTEGREEYALIKDMKDSRLRYHRFEENQGYAENILKVCEMSKGKYAVIVSDEDFMILENLEENLRFIKAHPDFGVFFSNIKDCLPSQEERFSKNGVDSIIPVSTWSYMTGFTYNMRLCHQLKTLECLENMRCGENIYWKDEASMLNKNGKNLYLELFVHDCIGIILGYHAGLAISNVELWDYETYSSETEKSIGFLYKPSIRIILQNSLMDFFGQALELNKSELITIFLVKCKWTHYLVDLSFSNFLEDMLKIGSEWEVQSWIYKEQLRYLDEFPISLSQEEYQLIREKISRVD